MTEALIQPPAPDFYQLTKTIDNIVDHTVAKILDQFRIHVDIIQRWQGLPEGRR